jgi:hypothetical protein
VAFTRRLTERSKASSADNSDQIFALSVLKFFNPRNPR